MKRYIYLYKNRFISIMLISCLIAMSKVLLSITMGKFTNSAVVLDKKNLAVFGSISIASLLLICIFEKIELFIRNKFTKNCILSLKDDVYKSLLYSSNSELHKEESAYYINAVINEVNTLRSDYFNNVCSCIGVVFQIVLGSVALIMINIKLFILISMISVIPMFINPALKKNVGIKKRKYIDSTKTQYQVINELFNGIDTIRMNQVVNKFKEKVMGIEHNQEQARFESDYNDNSVVTVTRCVGMTSQIICMLIAAFFVASGEIQIGAMIASTQLLNYVFPSINLLNSKQVIIKGTKGLRSDIESILNYKMDKGTKNFISDNIIFENFSINFNNKPVFQNFTYTFYKNTKVAIIGESGKGKSTLVKTLLGLNQEYDGKIKIGNCLIKDINMESLYRNVAYAPQKPFIFKGSLEDNISMYKTYDIEKLEKLIKDLKLDELKGKLLEDESSLSGGEASRLGVARAIMKESDVIIFDEPASAVDPITSSIINEVIFKIKNKTILVITHDWDEKYLCTFDKVLNLNESDAIKI